MDIWRAAADGLPHGSLGAIREEAVHKIARQNHEVLVCLYHSVRESANMNRYG